MKDMVRTARVGVELLARAPIPLFAGSVAWTLLNAATGWLGLGPLLLGPALYGMFLVALKALRGGHPTWQDNFAALKEPTTPLVAGVVFALPFSLWSLVRDFGQAMEVSNFARDVSAIPGVPTVASLAILVFFSVYVFVFPVLADGCGSLAEGLRTVHGLAERPVPAGSPVTGLGRQLVYTSVILIGIYLAALTWKLNHGAPFLFSILASPLAVALVAAWYQHRLVPVVGSEPGAGGEGAGGDEADEYEA